MAEAIRSKLAELAAMRKLPRACDKAGLEQAKSGLSQFEQGRTEAGTAAQSGDLVSATEKARAADAKARELLKTLGLPPDAPAPNK